MIKNWDDRWRKMPLAQEEETKVYFIYKDNTKIQESSRVLNFWNIFFFFAKMSITI